MAAAAWLASGAFAAESVRDPRASFLDVAARRAELRAPNAASVVSWIPKAADCSAARRPQPPRGRMEMPSYYLHGSHGPENPAYAAGERPYWAMERRVGEAATRYVAMGRGEDAQCVLDVLDDWARAGALLEYASPSQSWYQVEWSGASAALALSIAATHPGLDPTQLTRVTAWLDRVARKSIAEPAASKSLNNHLYWRGLMAAAVGVVAKDDALFRYGIDAYRSALREIAADGSLPREMDRHERALHYQNFALEPLVAIAELAGRQGYDLYALKSESGKTLHDAVAFLLDALEDPSRVARYASEPQYRKTLTPGSADLGWMEAYARRFRGERLSPYLTRPVFNVRLGGNCSVFWRAPAR